MSIKTEYDAVKAKLEELQAELAALPTEFTGKGDAEIAALYHKIVAYFGGVENIPADIGAEPAANDTPPAA